MTRSMIRTWQRRIHVWSKSKGWWRWDGLAPGYDFVLPAHDLALPLHADGRIHRAVVVEKLCLIHSEVTEALEEVRAGHPFAAVRTIEGKPEGFPTELADTVIRIFDLAEACGIDLETEIDRKMDYNRRRPYKHGGKTI